MKGKTLHGYGDVWTIGGLGVCIVKHPTQPSSSRLSRGRKIHLAKDKRLSICNMLVDEYIPDNNRNWSPVMNGKCKICFNGKGLGKD